MEYVDLADIEFDTKYDKKSKDAHRERRRSRSPPMYRRDDQKAVPKISVNKKMTVFAGAEAKQRAREDREWERQHVSKIQDARAYNEAQIQQSDRAVQPESKANEQSEKMKLLRDKYGDASRKKD